MNVKKIMNDPLLADIPIIYIIKVLAAIERNENELEQNKIKRSRVSKIIS